MWSELTSLRWSCFPLLELVSARLGQVATASTSVGSMACVQLSDLLRGRGTPQILAALRKYFPRTFDPPKSEITALAKPTARPRWTR